MEEVKQKKGPKSIIFLLIIILLIISGTTYLYMNKDNNVQELKNNINTNTPNIVGDLQRNDNQDISEEYTEIDPENIINEVDSLDKEEEEIDNMIDDLEELDI